ncbi:MAG: type I restriction endonuclease subunit S [Polaromonas sp.]|nr:type I restriction endonuclease subunit S [Polaromonas sp.]
MSAVMEVCESSAKYLSALHPPLVKHFNLIATAPDGVARLRELILALAVRGRLVQQDPSDEPASKLLKKIHAEKSLLVAEGKRKSDKPLADIAEDEMPFGLPPGWQWAQLGKITTQVTDGTHHTPKYLQSGVAFISVKDIDGKTVSFADCKFISVEEHRQINARCCPERGDLLLCRIGTLGRPTLVDTDRPFSLFVSVGLLKLPKSCNISSYFHLAMKSPLLVAQYDAIKAGGSHTNKLNLGDIPRLLLPIPPLGEQSRIVARVEELMRLCDALEAKGQLEAAQHAQLVQTLLGALTASTSPEELAENWRHVATHFDLLLDRPEAIDALEQTILQLALRGLLVPQDPTDEPASALLQKIRAEKDRLISEDKIKRDKPMSSVVDADVPFLLPSGWTWVRFDELIHPLKPIAYGVLVPGPDVEAGVPFVRIADLSIDMPAPLPEKSIGHDIDRQFQRTRLEGGEILMGVVGSIGKLGVAPPTWAGANIARAICRIVPADSGLKDFVLFLLQTDFMHKNFAGDTRTLAQPTLNIGLIRQALTPVPPPAEQARIVARVESLRGVCAELRQRLAVGQTTKTYLAEALIGEVT